MPIISTVLILSILKCFAELLCLFVSDSGLGAPTGFGGSVQHSSSNRRDYDDGGSPKRNLSLDGLPHFEKNFYVESPAVRAMTDAEVNEYRQQREITVEGRDIPKPVKSFHDAGFPGISVPFFFYFISFAFHLLQLKVHDSSLYCFVLHKTVSRAGNLEGLLVLWARLPSKIAC